MPRWYHRRWRILQLQERLGVATLFAIGVCATVLPFLGLFLLIVLRLVPASTVLVRGISEAMHKRC